MAIIEVQGLWKKFRLRQDRAENISTLFINLFRKLPNMDKELWALKDINFTVQEGKSLGIIGVNGSGKSTLLKILTGTLRPTRGQITVRGRRSSLIELGAGFHPDFSGRDNVYLNGLILGMSRAQVKRKFDEIVAFAELEQFIDVPVKYYSSGMQARLGFAVATAVEPEILIVDEVLAVGDGNFQQKCLARIREMQRRGTSILLVSHTMKDIETICDEALWLHKGEAVRFGEAKDVVREYQINQRLPFCQVKMSGTG
ncbi:ABC transporter ATP-binding protein [Neomoorella thermoacetica]|uniref:ABC transporter ATP-binding protein n=1 Tax=Neomoorella thermoacetica TaxID=1525 RepID=UPI0004703841|nr:ABC transporter ATP-binding protein [Moorella thermoacetica]